MAKSIATTRSELQRDLLAELARKTVITPEIEEKVWAKVLTVHPYGLGELEGFVTKVVLTKDEVVAAAIALGIIGEDDAHGVTVYVMPEDSINGKRKGDVQCISTVDDKHRESTIRSTKGTEMEKYGSLLMFRPMHERTNDKTKSMADEILEG